jgi:peroxiredoxin
MPSLERNLDRFEGYDAQVVGISTDSVHATRAWAKSLGGISFPLLSDFYPHGRVAEEYGVLRSEGMAERAVIVVDKSGIVRYVDVHEIGDAPDMEQILDALRKLES